MAPRLTCASAGTVGKRSSMGASQILSPGRGQKRKVSLVQPTGDVDVASAMGVAAREKAEKAARLSVSSMSDGQQQQQQQQHCSSREGPVHRFGSRGGVCPGSPINLATTNGITQSADAIDLSMKGKLRERLAARNIVDKVERKSAAGASVLGSSRLRLPDGGHPGDGTSYRGDGGGGPAGDGCGGPPEGGGSVGGDGGSSGSGAGASGAGGGGGGAGGGGAGLSVKRERGMPAVAESTSAPASPPPRASGSAGASLPRVSEPRASSVPAAPPASAPGATKNRGVPGCQPNIPGLSGTASSPERCPARSRLLRMSATSRTAPPEAVPEVQEPAAGAGSAGLSELRAKVLEASKAPEVPEVPEPSSKGRECEEEARPAVEGEGSARPRERLSAASRAASVKELKAQLAEQGLDSSRCVEKSDLEALWARFQLFRNRPLRELQVSCATAGGPLGGFPTADECARYLVDPPTQGGSCLSATATKPAVCTPSERSAETTLRDNETTQEVSRILSLRREAYSSASSWGYAVLRVDHDLASVQRGFRTIMKRLHPDKVGDNARAANAIEVVREAKDTCERSLSRQEPPTAPKALRSALLCSVPGSRKLRLSWTAPPERASAVVKRYVIAVFDPAYGRALTVTVLEPDYSQELRRFVSMDELTTYILAEEDLQKMPSLWKQTSVTVQVAAANEAGQSSWVQCVVSLSASTVVPPAPAKQLPAKTGGAPTSSVEREDKLADAEFEQELKVMKDRGISCRTWLEKQTKVRITAWLRSVGWPAIGTKTDLVERVIVIIDGRM
eukprot:NODE_974_length_2666_cov_13.062623.p1 GENE.NODE_974_length_2666_cov_13.062623~~NODE_974_length_2666_cov_13.062623.p1  ORF type:complete len:867 (-),score=69.60 NODE_974_length_2666_cov_13.062623:65-2440(-)